MRTFILIFCVLFYSLCYSEPLRITAIGNSTFSGYYNGIPHMNDYNASIPLMVYGAVEWYGVSCIMTNKALPSVSVDWHLGRKDGDESIYEPPLSSSSPCTPYNLAKDKSNVIIINLGINDAIFCTPDSFYSDFIELIDNCKRTGKIVYITMPNQIMDGNQHKLNVVVSHIQTIARIKEVTVVNSGVQYIQLNDNYHPVPGPIGYEKLGQALKDRIGQDAKDILNHIIATRYYIAMFNRTPEKEGLTYWANELHHWDDRNLVANMVVSAVEEIEGAITDPDYIYRIYNNLLQRLPDLDGYNYWTWRLNSTSRGHVMNEIIDVLVNCTNNTPQGLLDQRSLQNRTSVGLAYAYVYKKMQVAPYNNLSNVTSDYNTVYSATQGW